MGRLAAHSLPVLLLQINGLLAKRSTHRKSDEAGGPPGTETRKVGFQTLATATDGPG